MKSKDEVRKVNMIVEVGFGYEKAISNKMVLSICSDFRIQNFTFLNDEIVNLNRRLFFYGISFNLMAKL